MSGSQVSGSQMSGIDQSGITRIDQSGMTRIDQSGPVWTSLDQFSWITWARSLGLEPYLAEPHLVYLAMPLPGYPYQHHPGYTPPAPSSTATWVHGYGTGAKECYGLQKESA